MSGDTLFETMLVHNGRIVLLEEHAARMAASCRALGFPPLDVAAFRATALAATRDDGALRILYGTAQPLEATAFAIPPTTLARKTYGRAITLDRTIKRTLPQHKLMSHYALCTTALRNAVAAGADEALFVDPRGAYLEGTATNLFAVRGKTLITAPSAVLPGIVREWLLARANDLGYTIEPRAPTVDELREGAFFTGSLTELAPLRVLDGASCRPPGEAFGELLQAWRAERDAR